jgi:hypothetical protein
MIMEPPSFLSKSDPPPANEWPAAEPERPQNHPMFEPSRPKKDLNFDDLKNNPVVVGILIGIVIGVILMNMRPVIINPTK